MSRRPPVADWTSDFDHPDPRWVEDPFPIWDELRQKCPIAHTDRFMGVYLPTRYEDVRAIAYDTEHFSSHRVVVREGMPPKRADHLDKRPQLRRGRHGLLRRGAPRDRSAATTAIRYSE